MNGNIVSKYLDFKMNNITKYFEILSSYSIGNKKELRARYQSCIRYYIQNYMLYDKELNDKNYETFFKSNFIKNDMQKKYLVSMFQTFVSFESSISSPALTNFTIEISEIFVLATLFDNHTNLLYGDVKTFAQTYTEVKEVATSFGKDTLKVLDKSKRNIKLSIQNVIKDNKKFKKELMNNDFFLNFKPIFDAVKGENTIYYIDLKYKIDDFNIYSTKDIDYIYMQKDMQNKMFLIAYDLASLELIKLAEQGIKGISLIVTMPQGYTKKSNPTKQLLKIANNLRNDNLLISTSYDDYMNNRYNYDLMLEKGIKFCTNYDKTMLKERKLPFKYIMLHESEMSNVDNITFFFKRLNVMPIFETNQINEKVKLYDRNEPFIDEQTLLKK